MLSFYKPVIFFVLLLLINFLNIINSCWPKPTRKPKICAYIDNLGDLNLPEIKLSEKDVTGIVYFLKSYHCGAEEVQTKRKFHVKQYQSEESQKKDFNYDFEAELNKRTDEVFRCLNNVLFETKENYPTGVSCCTEEGSYFSQPRNNWTNETYEKRYDECMSGYRSLLNNEYCN